ncbi:MAG: peptidylprolyl isomerase [Rikenellaceae bacterium]
MFKRLILPLMATILTLSAFAEPQRVLLDKVVAIVGSSPILHSEVSLYAQQIIARRRAEGYTSDRDPKVEALEELLTQKLLYSQALIDSVEINLSDVQGRVEQQLNLLIDNAGGIRALEKQQGMEIFNIRATMRKKMEEQSYAQNMKYSVASGVTIVPGQVESYYNSIDPDSLPMIGDQYTYAQITRLPSNVDEAKRRAKENLLELRGRAIRGETRFSILAQMYSVDPGSAYRGGEMDPQPSSAFVPAFADALEALLPGQISEVVETEFGYHIIELIDAKDGKYHCRHILLRPTYAADDLAEPLEMLDSLAREIRSGSISFEQAALDVSDDDASKMNGGIVSNHDLLKRYNAYDAKLTVTKFLKEDFGTRGYKSIDDLMALNRLQEGEVSDAFATTDISGDQISKIVKLVDILPAHRASLAEDYLRLEQMALEDRKTKIFNKWLNERIEGMYIHIAPEYRNADFANPSWVK